MPAELDDELLMAQVVAGNHDAFAQLVSRHTSRFFALAFRTLQNQSDAEDIVQAVFIKLWQNPAAWNKEKAQFTTWFYRVVLNACHDFSRKHRKATHLTPETLEALSPPVTSEQTRLEEDQLQRWRQQCLMIAMQRLPSSQRDALNLVVYGQMPQKQTAEVLGTTVKAVESLLVRAKRSIAKTVNEIEKADLQPPRDLHRESKL